MIDYGHGVILGRLGISEAARALLRKWRNHPDVMSWCRQRDMLEMQTHADWLATQAADPSVQMYCVNAPKNGTVGVCGLTDLDPWNRRAEFSLYIGPEFQKNGYGRMALKSLLQHGFNTYGLNVIWGESFDGNPAIKMFEELGMIREGTRRQFYFKNGKWLDAHLYSITAEEWMDSDK